MMFIGPVKLKYVALVMVVLDILGMAGTNAGGHIAHLGGALWGYIYQREFLKGNDIGGWFMRMVAAFQSLFSASKSTKKRNAKRRTSKTNPGVDQQKVDAILDKIAASGYESLTKAEKEYLFQAGKQ